MRHVFMIKMVQMVSKTHGCITQGHLLTPLVLSSGEKWLRNIDEFHNGGVFSLSRITTRYIAPAFLIGLATILRQVFLVQIEVKVNRLTNKTIGCS